MRIVDETGSNIFAFYVTIQTHGFTTCIYFRYNIYVLYATSCTIIMLCKHYTRITTSTCKYIYCFHTKYNTKRNLITWKNLPKNIWFKIGEYRQHLNYPFTKLYLKCREVNLVPPDLPHLKIESNPSSVKRVSKCQSQHGIVYQSPSGVRIIAQRERCQQQQETGYVKQDWPNK